MPLTVVLENFGLRVAIGSLGFVQDHVQAIRYFFTRVAKISSPLFNLWFPEDKRVERLIEVAENYCLGQVTKENLANAYDTIEDLASSVSEEEWMTNGKFDDFTALTSLLQFSLDPELDLGDNGEIATVYDACHQSLFYYILYSVIKEDVEDKVILNQGIPIKAYFTVYGKDSFFDPSREKFFSAYSDIITSISTTTQQLLTDINLKVDLGFLKPLLSESIWSKFYCYYFSKILTLFVNEIFNLFVKPELLNLFSLSGVYGSLVED
ncbi:MAG: hypothetical protein LBT86_04875 [Deltaproteobacteria bacterium]|nr:hypothetical protein [Deltaproteobacteria bacterium]